MDHLVDQTERVISYFSGEQGQENYERLVHFAHVAANRHVWCSGRFAALPGGRSPQDLVNDLLLQVLKPSRARSHRRIPIHVDLGQALRMHLRSKLSAAANSFENRNFLRSGDLLNEVGRSFTSLFGSQPLWPQTTEAAATDHQAEPNRWCDQFIESVSNDSILHGMLILLRDHGIGRPAELVAARLGVSVHEVYLARRRLKSAMQRFMKTQSHP